MSGKKKTNLPKDDLIDHLLDDVNDIAADPGIADPPDFDFDEKTSPGATGHAPVGLVADGATKAVIDNPWDAFNVPATRVAEGNETSAEPSSFSKIINLDASVNKVNFPMSEKNRKDGQTYQGPSIEAGYQSIDEVQAPAFESAEGHESEATRPVYSEATAAPKSSEEVSDHEATVAAGGIGNRRPNKSEPQEKVVIGALRGSRAGNVMTSVDASLAQAESLKIAQQRLLELEKENDRLRRENEEVSSAADIIRGRLEELTAKVTKLEREKVEVQEAAQNEVVILKGNLQYKESEVAKARLKIDELDTRLKSDFKKIRVKERELENRLELARAEKAALIRAKDENILDLKRKADQMQTEIDNYRDKCLELNKTIDAYQEQFKRTIRALHLALTNLEAKDDTVVPLKKAD